MELSLKDLRELINADDSVASPPTAIGSRLIGKKVICRGRIAGVWIGTLDAIGGPTGQAVDLSDARRIWSWRGAAELSQLSQRGVNETHSDTRIGVTVPTVTVLEVGELLPVSADCAASISRVPEWTK